MWNESEQEMLAVNESTHSLATESLNVQCSDTVLLTWCCYLSGDRSICRKCDVKNRFERMSKLKKKEKRKRKKKRTIAHTSKECTHLMTGSSDTHSYAGTIHQKGMSAVN